MDESIAFKNLLSTLVIRSLRDTLRPTSAANPNQQPALERHRIQAINWFFDTEPKQRCTPTKCQDCHPQKPSTYCQRITAQEAFDLLGLDGVAFREQLRKALIKRGVETTI